MTKRLLTEHEIDMGLHLKIIKFENVKLRVLTSNYAYL